MLVLLASPHRAVSRSSSPRLYHRALLAIRAFTRTSMVFSVRKISGGGVVCCVREREQKERAKAGVARGGWAGVRRERKRAEIEKERQSVSRMFWKMVYGKKKFVNRFPIFFKGFSVQRQIIYVDFYFTAKQTPANDENILRKMFYVETNGA